MPDVVFCEESEFEVQIVPKPKKKKQSGNSKMLIKNCQVSQRVLIYGEGLFFREDRLVRDSTSGALSVHDVPAAPDAAPAALSMVP